MNIFQFSLLQLFLPIIIVSSKLLTITNESVGKSADKLTNKLTDESLSILKQDKDIADMYVFAYIWEPESCYTNPSWSQCTSPQTFWETNFVIHGLWPQYSSGGYPSTCTNEPFDNSVVEAIGMDTMNQYWPNVKSNTSAPDYNSFWQHEWTKHGTCSPLNQYEYFNTTINLSKLFGTPSIITVNVGNTISAEQIRNTFGGPNMVSLQCESGNYLSGIFTCWSMSSSNNGIPDKQISCPADVIGEDNCSNDTIVITSFA